LKKPRLDLTNRLARKRQQRFLKLAFLAGLGLMLANLILNVTIRLSLNESKPADAILVLGGSIRREIYATQLAKQEPDIPILISQGSKDPCIRLLFERAQARLRRIWLEKCAHSTFDNFFFSTPILRRWGVHKVKIITSASHLPRAEWLARIHLGSQGIAVEMDTVREIGIPGNREFAWKTNLDVTRSLIWAFFSQVLQPPCFDVIELADVNLGTWDRSEFSCEAQGGIF
jgi:uncharacterized SAM-binding protein YcdF (DUF218 family)